MINAAPLTEQPAYLSARLPARLPSSAAFCVPVRARRRSALAGWRVAARLSLSPSSFLILNNSVSTGSQANC